MRPLKLIMSAFGPYGGTEELDFASFGETGIYLITGPTGSGKTSIFDAICFALFGKLSSTSRDAALFQSDHRVDDRETAVELEFEIRGEAYTVSRRFKRRKERATGEYVFDSKQDAELVWPDGSAISGTNQVNPQIEELIGLDFDQFTKIVMLSQGEFKRFLEAKSADRSKIFASIFDTSLYRRIMEVLKGERDALSEQMKEREQLALAALRTVSIVENEESAARFDDALTRGVLGAGDALVELDAAIEIDREKDGDLRKRHTKVNNEVKQVSEKVGKAKQREKAATELENAKAELEREESSLPALEEAVERQEALVPEQERLLSDKAVIESSFPSYEELDDKRLLLKKTCADLFDARKQLEDARTEYVRVRQELDTARKAIEENASASVDLVKAQTSIEQAQAELANVREAQRDCSEHRGNLDALAGATTASTRANEDFDAASKTRLRLEQAYLNAQAGILATGLSAGEPCPVCGSLDHPSKAHLAEDVPTPEQVEEARIAEEDARQRAYTLAQEAAARGEAASNSSSKVCAAARELLDGGHDPEAGELLELQVCAQVEERLDELARDVEGKLETLREDEKRFDAAGRAYRKALGDRDELEERLTKIQTDGEQISQEVAHLDADVAHLEASAASLEEMLPFPSKDEARAAASELERKVGEMKTTREKVIAERDECQRRISAAQAIIENNSKLLRGSKLASVTELEAQASKLSAEQKGLERALRDVSNRLSLNRSAREEALKRLASHGEIEARLAVVSSLADTALGNVKGSERIPLETYVQTVFFDQMLEFANQRLSGMSGGRYLLVRHQGDTRKTAKGGLDIDVLDNDTGQHRSASTLSGGESFIASLSLALGLSDVTQGYAGGIDLECMFIDEGFGSLDEDALDLALGTLAQIGAEDKLVGIISHVEELKRVVPRKIVVSKSRTGSHVSTQLG